ncbi:MAG: hypothetical protein Rubg2KO_39830 [Rubricoccaceae bacterium]
MQRRRFLQLFSAASLAAIAPVGQLVAFQSRDFVSPPLGLRLTPPAGWHWPDFAEVVRNLERQTFVSDELAPNEGPAPLIAFYKVPEPHPDMNPGIWIYADRVEPWMGSPLDLADQYLAIMSESVLEPHVAQPPTHVELAGRPAAQVVFQYRAIAEEEGFDHHVTDLSTLVYHNGHVIWLLMEDSRDGPENETDTFESVLRSVSLT